MAEQQRHMPEQTLPERLPVFPLTGVLLLPGGKLPLNIFEQRYLDMVSDAMSGDRMIGMVQPTAPAHDSHAPDIYPVGCAGRITVYEETDDGRYLITLTGLCRFDIREELSTTTRYRQVLADWSGYADDLEPPDEAGIDRACLLPALRAYLDAADIPADWSAIEKASSVALVNYLSMICPFTPSEKQALLEAADVAARSKGMTSLMEMAVMQSGGGDGDDGQRH